MVKDIRRATRRHFSAEDKIRIVLAGLRGDDSIAELRRKEGIAQSLYYTWSKEFMEAGKRHLAGDTARAATTAEVKDLGREGRRPGPSAWFSCTRGKITPQTLPVLAATPAGLCQWSCPIRPRFLSELFLRARLFLLNCLSGLRSLPDLDRAHSAVTSGTGCVACTGPSASCS